MTRDTGLEKLVGKELELHAAMWRSVIEGLVFGHRGTMREQIYARDGHRVLSQGRVSRPTNALCTREQNESTVRMVSS